MWFELLLLPRLIRFRLNKIHHRRCLHFICVMRLSRSHAQLIHQLSLVNGNQGETFFDARRRVIRKGVE